MVLGPWIQHLVLEETAPDRHDESAHGARPSFFTPPQERDDYDDEIDDVRTDGPTSHRARDEPDPVLHNAGPDKRDELGADAALRVLPRKVEDRGALAVN
jgi:hypothetical protein